MGEGRSFGDIIASETACLRIQRPAVIHHIVLTLHRSAASSDGGGCCGGVVVVDGVGWLGYESVAQSCTDAAHHSSDRNNQCQAYSLKEEVFMAQHAGPSIGSHGCVMDMRNSKNCSTLLA